MPTDPTRPLARQLFAAVLRAEGGPTDRELLAQFVADRSEAAFAELVRRHGSMVLAVCRRVTQHPQDAEDAFQAAFLVLARRAGQVARPELLGNWLYGVAYRTALEARGLRRRVKELQVVSDTPEPASPEPPEDTADLRVVIDEELARLPDKYRSAVVLCGLEGLSRKDAAERLRVPEGTLSSRLAHARKVLAGRLTRRGITASAGAVATTLGRDAAATAVSPAMVLGTARAAARFASGGLLPPDLVPNHVTTLTDGVMKAMIVNRLRLITGAAVLAAGVLGLGAAATLAQRPAQRAQNGYYVPLAGLAAGQQQAPEKGRAPEKVPAKGIEDDDVPYPTTPSQAVVRLEDDKLIVRQRTRGYVASTRELENGSKVNVYEVKTTVGGRKYDPADVSVFDMKGNRVAEKTWKERLKKDTHALVAFDGRLPHPRELQLFKDDTWVVVLPAHGASGQWTPTPYGGFLEQVFPGDLFTPPAQNIPSRPPADNPTPPGRRTTENPTAQGLSAASVSRALRAGH
jgi:RNA polymerase sigma factor (sigma-70 family)